MGELEEPAEVGRRIADSLSRQLPELVSSEYLVAGPASHRLQGS